MLAFQQNIIVTVPANTRFYLVLNEPGVTTSAPRQDTVARGGTAALSGALDVPPVSPLAGMSPQELQELVAIRNEMREMNRLIKMQNPPSVPQQEPEN
jgi:hypothetical protein